MFYIIHEQGVPDNVITYGLEPKGLTSQREWLEFCRDNAADVPEDIPKRPDVVYSKWVS